MRKFYMLFGVVAVVFAISLFAGEMSKSSGKPEWSMNATAIEACSCPMFCQCYFNSEPAGHHEHGAAGATHYCRANIAYKINKGHNGAVDLTGAKFWLTSDLGPDFSKGEMDWVILTFDKSLGKEQRDAITTIAGALFPVKWKSFKTAEGNIDTWVFDEKSAHATLDGGKTAEVKLVRPATALSDGPVVVKNLRYWGAPRNDGFVLMPNEVQAYRVGDKAFEFKGTNGFMITVDMNSNDVAKPAAM